MRHLAFPTVTLVLLVPLLLILAGTPALATDAACVEKFKTLVLDGYPDAGPVRIHVFQEMGGSKTENYFHNPGDSSGDGMMQPLKNMGEMWVLFREKKMYTSTDGGETWQFGRDMDDASQPEAYKAQVRKDLGTADQVACGQEAVGEVLHDTVEGQFASSALQGALMHSKYWIKQDTGFISQHETRSDGAGGAFYALQIIEQVPGLELPKVD